MKQELNIVNKKAEYEFFLVEKYVAGMMLTGTEIKSVRQGKVNMSDAFCAFDKEGELYLRNMHISEYTHGSYANHEPKRPRKLLLKKKEKNRLATKIKEKGFTLIPYRIFISATGFAKIEISLAKGKKHYDKRESIKDRDVARDLRRGE